jgi:hypothetical protein
MAGDKLIVEVSAAIGHLGEITNDIKQKLSLFGTPQDKRVNHEHVNELSKEGRDIVKKVTGQLQSLANSASQKSAARKLTKDFKAQASIFEQVCASLATAEQSTVEFIRKTSEKSAKKEDLANYSEDQIYAQAQVNVYNEDGMAYIYNSCSTIFQIWRDGKRTSYK